MGLGCHIVQLQFIPVACIQCLPQSGKRVYHTQFPTVHYSTPPLDPDWCTIPGTNESGFDKGCSIFWWKLEQENSIHTTIYSHVSNISR